MHVKVVSDENKFYQLRGQWNALLDRSPSCSVYLTWEWLFTWWKVYQDGSRRLHIIVLEDDSGIIKAIGPFLVARKTIGKIFHLKVLESLGTGEEERDEVCSNYMDLIFDPNIPNFSLIFDHVFDGLKTKLWDQVCLRSIPRLSGESIWQKAKVSGFKIELLNLSECAIINLPNQWELYLGSLNKKWRDQIKRGRKEVASLGEIESVTVTSPEQIDPAFDEFINLHQRKWQHEGQGGLFTSAKFTRFHQEIVKKFSQKGWIAINLLKMNSRVVAASYTFRYNKGVYFYLPAYDKDVKTKIGLGVVERSYDIEQVISQGYKVYDFYKARPGSYKWHLAKDKKEVVDVIIYKKGLMFSTINLLKKIKSFLKRCLGRTK